ncbi:MAG: DUF1003 domain-containing protein [Terricaulis sp.]
MPKNAHDLLVQLRDHAAARRKKPPAIEAPKTFADRAADWIAGLVGSWRFVIIQSALLAAWLIFNIVSQARVDPYPFILLNLLLSFQAAYTAPVIMMSQNRQSDIDRARNMEDYEVNRKAELEIETLHEKIDLLREQEIAQLTAAIARLTKAIEAKGVALSSLTPIPGLALRAPREWVVRECFTISSDRTDRSRSARP